MTVSPLAELAERPQERGRGRLGSVGRQLVRQVRYPQLRHAACQSASGRVR